MYVCSQCGKDGHNKLSCPQSDNQIKRQIRQLTKYEDRVIQYLRSGDLDRAIYYIRNCKRFFITPENSAQLTETYFEREFHFTKQKNELHEKVSN